MEKYKIVADSSADLLATNGGILEVAPLKIITTEKEFTDNADLDVKEMVDFLLSYKGRSSSSCPNPDEWLSAFDNAQYVFCVPITAGLSGSYNAALVAKEMYESEHPDRKVFVLNTLTAGPEMALMVEKLEELISKSLSFEEICDQITEYINHTGLLFMLESMKNLANNGRVNPIVAKAAGLLGIRVVGRASEQGDLEQIAKCKGSDRSLRTIVEEIKKAGCTSGKIRIAHCFNLEAAENLKKKIYIELPRAKVEIYNCRGLCSFYAEKGGMLVGFEKI